MLDFDLNSNFWSTIDVPFLLWNWCWAHPFPLLLLIIFLYLVFKIYRFNEVVVDYPKVVPTSVRHIPSNDLPPDYPNGWIPILESRAIAPGQVKSVLVLGQELAVFRSSTGQVTVADAFCPHLGANLAVGGTVHRDCDKQEDCIRCPFHGWSFRLSDGSCAEVPYEDAPVNAKLKLWISTEWSNNIFVWHHAEGEPPTWQLPEEDPRLKELAYRGRTDFTFNCHVQDIIENSADIGHFEQIHVLPEFLGSSLDVLRLVRRLPRILGYTFQTSWRPLPEPDTHLAELQLVTENRLFGVEFMTIKLTITHIGPASLVLHVSTDILGGNSGLVVLAIKPITHMRSAIVANFYTTKCLSGALFGKLAIWGEAVMLRRDIEVWNRKAYIRRPLATKAEKSLVGYRRWYRQFYSGKGNGRKSILDW